MVTLTSCVHRLVVTEAGRDDAIAHLEVSFVHQYEERQTVTENQTPPQRKVGRPETWKKNKRSLRASMSRVETSCDADLVEGNAACQAHDKCSAECLSVSLIHRQEARALARKVWKELGQVGFYAFVEGPIDVKEPNMTTIAKHGASCEPSALTRCVQVSTSLAYVLRILIRGVDTAGQCPSTMIIPRILLFRFVLQAASMLRAES
jgi:hypothetical protein